jgi:hypothetical protein
MSLNVHSTIENMTSIAMMMIYVILFMGGVSFTCGAFENMYKKTENHFWYMLPATPLEKFVAKLLFTWLVYFVIVIVGFVVMMSISQLFFTSNSYIFNPSSSFVQNTFIPDVSEYFKSYMFYNAIFLLGASFFREKVLIKTSIALVLLIIAAIVALFVFTQQAGIEYLKTLYDYHEAIPNINSLLFFGIILILWVLAFYFTKRSTVADGV